MNETNKKTGLITLTNVTKTFAGKTVLKNVSLQFSEGHTHVLLGASGCGKSTLLRLVMGLTLADSGSISVADIEVSAQTQEQISNQIGYVIQEGGLFPHLTAGENVSLVAKIRKWPKQKVEQRLHELSNLMELEHALLGRYPNELSGGQKQRVGLMRALMLNPALLVLDEPFGALDPIVRSLLQAELKKIFNSVKKTVLLVTHDVGEAAYFGHTITLLNEGHVVQQGSFQELCRHPSDPFVTEFINAQRLAPGVEE